MIKLRVLRKGDYPRLSGESRLIIRVLIRRRQEGQSRSDDMMVGAEVAVMSFKGGGRGH